MKSFLASFSLLCGLVQPASATVVFALHNLTSHSVTFSISGQMPLIAPETLLDGPHELDIRYSGNLWAGGNTYTVNSLSADPVSGAGGLLFGNTGGFGLPDNYSWLFFENPLTSLYGTTQPVTLTWGGNAFLNPGGTGAIELYWGNLSLGSDPDSRLNMLLGKVDVVRGEFDTPASEVPEPGGIAMFALGLVILRARRRRQKNAQRTSVAKERALNARYHKES